MRVSRVGTKFAAVLRNPRSAVAAFALLTCTTAICATFARAQAPIRTLSAPRARTAEPVRNIFNDVRERRDGTLLVNDVLARRLLLLDTTLAVLTVVRDSAAGTPTSYGPRAAPLLPFLGDSSLLVDIPSQSLLVLDAHGNTVRVMAPPAPRDVSLLAAVSAGVDALGRLIYRGNPTRASPEQRGADSTTIIIQASDSAPVLRADFITRTVDTIARLRVQGPPRSIRMTVGERVSIQNVVNPLQTLDDWTITADGRVALVRGADYHIDWIEPSGAITRSGKLPFDWRRITEEEKRAILDSAATAQRVRDSTVRAGDAARGAAGTGARGAPVGVGNAVVSVTPGGDVIRPGAVQTTFVRPEELPDYYPPLRAGWVRADLDGNVWVLPATTLSSVAGELVYDVIDRAGALTHRVRVPPNRSIAGFGPGGVVYLKEFVAGVGWFLERTRIER
jgi:hypothetical protein